MLLSPLDGTNFIDMGRRRGHVEFSLDDKYESKEFFVLFFFLQKCYLKLFQGMALIWLCNKGLHSSPRVINTDVFLNIYWYLGHLVGEILSTIRHSNSSVLLGS